MIKQTYENAVAEWQTCGFLARDAERGAAADRLEISKAPPSRISSRRTCEKSEVSEESPLCSTSPLAKKAK